jgi:hypothetical protein
MENNTGGSLNQNDQNQGSGSQNQQNQNDQQTKPRRHGP